YLCIIRELKSSDAEYKIQLFEKIYEKNSLPLWSAVIEILPKLISEYRDKDGNNLLYRLIASNQSLAFQKILGCNTNLLVEKNHVGLTVIQEVKRSLTETEVKNLLDSIRSMHIESVFLCMYWNDDLIDITDLLEAEIYCDADPLSRILLDSSQNFFPYRLYFYSTYERHALYAVKVGSLKGLKHYIEQANADRMPFEERGYEALSGERLLHVAVKLRYLEICSYLIFKCPKSLKEVDNDGNLPLHLAALSKDSKVASYLNVSSEDTRQEGELPDIFKPNKAGYLPIELALSKTNSAAHQTEEERGNELELIQVLSCLPKGNPHKMVHTERVMIFDHAIRSENPQERVRVLEKALDWNPNFYWEQADRYLREGNIEGFKKILNLSEETPASEEAASQEVSETKQLKPIIDVTCVKGARSLLHTAVECENREVIALLIATGVSVDLKNGSGDTVLHCAARNQKLPMVLYLIENCHAKTSVVNKKGASVLQEIRQFSEAEISKIVEQGYKNYLELDRQDDATGNTWLHEVVKARNYFFARQLIRWGANPCLENNANENVCGMIFNLESTEENATDHAIIKELKEGLFKSIQRDLEESKSKENAALVRQLHLQNSVQIPMPPMLLNGRAWGKIIEQVFRFSELELGWQMRGTTMIERFFRNSVVYVQNSIGTGAVTRVQRLRNVAIQTYFTGDNTLLFRMVKELVGNKKQALTVFHYGDMLVATNVDVLAEERAKREQEQAQARVKREQKQTEEAQVQVRREREQAEEAQAQVRREREQAEEAQAQVRREREQAEEAQEQIEEEQERKAKLDLEAKSAAIDAELAALEAAQLDQGQAAGGGTALITPEVATAIAGNSEVSEKTDSEEKVAKQKDTVSEGIYDRVGLLRDKRDLEDVALSEDPATAQREVKDRKEDQAEKKSALELS
ncbi:MAG: ankyrin repeat domain-containing protein, partial [Proteobacteria bacterium]|nr:ankyrin repeat domain-containing protein [Pseudomonadota bacterium]